MNPSTETAVLEGGVDRIALEKKREASMVRRVTRTTEPTSALGRHTGTEKNVCELENSGWWK